MKDLLQSLDDSGQGTLRLEEATSKDGKKRMRWVFRRPAVLPPPEGYPPEDPTGEDLVYFLYDRDNRKVKIGHSTDVRARIRAHRGSNPADLELLGTIPGGVKEEARQHKRFADVRHRDEWFHATHELLTSVRELIAARQILEPMEGIVNRWLDTHRDTIIAAIAQAVAANYSREMP